MASLLIAESDPTIRRHVVRMLEDDHVVRQAGTGTEAYRMLMRGGCDALITDIVLDGMDGIELAKQVREECPELRVFFLAGFSVVPLNHSEGTVRALGKPFHLRALPVVLDAELAHLRGIAEDLDWSEPRPGDLDPTA